MKRLLILLLLSLCSALVACNKDEPKPESSTPASPTGGEPARLTDADDLFIYATAEPNGDRIAYTSNSGVYILQPDGTIEPILIGSEYRMVSWMK